MDEQILGPRRLLAFGGGMYEPGAPVMDEVTGFRAIYEERKYIEFHILCAAPQVPCILCLFSGWKAKEIARTSQSHLTYARKLLEVEFSII